MKKKKIQLALIGFASVSLILAGCQQDPIRSESSSSSSSSGSVIPDTDDDDVVIGHNKIKLTSPASGEEIGITPEPLLNYLNAQTEADQIKALQAAKDNRNLTCTSVKLSWEKDGSAYYQVYIDENEDFSNPLIAKVSSLSTTYEAYNLIPNKTYYWKVQGTKTKDVSDVSTFKTLGSSVRFINASGGNNIRDLGGWKAEGEKTIAYGKLYRGALLNGYSNYGTLDESGKKTFNEELKIKTEIDLRIGDKDDGEQRKCFFDASKKYIRAQLGQYNRILDTENFAKSIGYDDFKSLVKANLKNSPIYEVDGITVRSLRDIFETLSDENNYPIYFHCNAGADRTGTLSFLLEGLLGVSYEDTVRDFELTSFSKFGDRYRSALNEEGTAFDATGVYMDEAGNNYVGFGKLHEDMLTYYGDGTNDLSIAISNYLTRYAGIPSSQIASFKEILLGEEESNLTLSERQEFLLDSESISLDLSKASLDEGSIESISLANLDLGKDPANISLAKIKEKQIAGEREIVVKAKKDGNDITVYAPVLFITKMITSIDELTAIDTYRGKDANKNQKYKTNYGYYRLANDIGSEKAPVNYGWWIQEQDSINGGYGFRGTLDGNGKKIFVKPNYGGILSVIGGGAEIKNVSFKVTTFGSSSALYTCSTVLGISLCGAVLEGVDFEVLSSGWGDTGYRQNVYQNAQGLISSSFAHGNKIKDVSIKSDVPLVSIFGGVSYDGLGGMDFDNFSLDCKELCYLGVKRSVGGVSMPIPVTSCYLPTDFEGIHGSYISSATNTVELKRNDKYASIELESRYGGMELLEATWNGKAIPDATIESGILVFKTKDILDDSGVSNGTISLKLKKNDISCDYSLQIWLAR